jgi:hypothetical protein
MRNITIIHIEHDCIAGRTALICLQSHIRFWLAGQDVPDARRYATFSSPVFSLPAEESHYPPNRYGADLGEKKHQSPLVYSLGGPVAGVVDFAGIDDPASFIQPCLPKHCVQSALP